MRRQSPVKTLSGLIQGHIPHLSEAPLQADQHEEPSVADCGEAEWQFAVQRVLIQTHTYLGGALLPADPQAEMKHKKDECPAAENDQKGVEEAE